MVMPGQSVVVSGLVKEAAQLIAAQGWPKWWLVVLIVVGMVAVTCLITIAFNAFWKRLDD
jgi:hypothetical protein